MDLKLDEMGFDYGEHEVLKHITFSVSEPQLVCILGPNGVGKSTLIHCINRILTRTKGTVMVNDRDVNEYKLKELACITGYVPYTATDSFPMTVVDTVMLGRHPHANRKSNDDDVRMAYQILEKLGIQDLAMRPFNMLSAGQHQKVMLARGLAQEPEILLLDEPTANLDVKHQMDVSRLLYDLAHEQKIVVVMICHDLNIASKYADNIILMHKGTVYAAGRPEEVMTEENIKEVYGVESTVIMDEGRPHVILRDHSEYKTVGCIDCVCSHDCDN